MTKDKDTQQNISIIITTTSTKKQAKDLGRQLVERQLAACVQITAIESIYTWEDEIQEDEEQRLMIKAIREREDEVAAYLRENHPYETPEIIMSDFIANADYYSWCRKVSGFQ